MNQNGDSVLTIATASGKLEMECLKSKCLLNKMASKISFSGITAIIRLIIEEGADVNHETRIRDTPIMLAAEKGNFKSKKNLFSLKNLFLCRVYGNC